MDVLEIGQGFIELSSLWDTIAAKMWVLHESGDAALLEEMSEGIAENYSIETRQLTKLQQGFQND